jgi:hypothetical protein
MQVKSWGLIRKRDGIKRSSMAGRSADRQISACFTGGLLIHSSIKNGRQVPRNYDELYEKLANWRDYNRVAN